MAALTFNRQYRIWSEIVKAYHDPIPMAGLLSPKGWLYMPTAGGDWQLVQIEDEKGFIIEFATGYLDTEGKMIYQGDRVENTYDRCVYTVVWGEFSDCCVDGQAWVLDESDLYQNCLGHWCSNDYPENRFLTIVGTVHDQK